MNVMTYPLRWLKCRFMNCIKFRSLATTGALGALLVACASTTAPAVVPPLQSAVPTPESVIIQPQPPMKTVDPAMRVPMPLGADTSPIDVPANDNLPAVIAARTALAEKLSVAPTTIRLVELQEVQWPDGCLGVRDPDVLCLQVIVDGYRMVFEANGTRYTYHTDLTGQQFVLASPR
jgi:hypothetical protein